MKVNLKPLKKHMRANNIQLSDLSEKLGVSRITLYRWLNGTRSPSSEHIIKIILITGIDANDLFPTSKGSNLL